MQGAQAQRPKPIPRIAEQSQNYPGTASEKPQPPTILDQSARIENQIDRMRSSVEVLESKCQPVVNSYGCDPEIPSNPYAGSSLGGGLSYHVEQLERLIERIDALCNAFDL